VKKLDPFEGVFFTLNEIATGGAKTSKLREDIFRDEWDDIVVDTCVAFDTDEWETGIWQEKDGNCIIVQQYSTKAKAKIGHNKWVRKLKKNPDLELEDLNLWDL